MNLFLHELKMARRPWVAWIVGLCLFASIYISVYPAFVHDVGITQAIIANYPAAFRGAIGLTLNIFSSFLGFYGFILALLMVVMAIQAMNLGLSSLSKEASMKTVDFLLSKPMSRSGVFFGKLGAALVVLLSTSLAVSLFIYALARMVSGENFDAGTFCLMSLCLVFIQIWFLAVGMAISAVVRRLHSVISLSLAIVVALDVVGSLGEVLGEDTVRYISPFKYFDFGNIIQTGGFETRYLVAWACISIVAYLVAYVVYRRKDIHAVY